MMCPLLTVGLYVGGMEHSYSDCVKEKCAWWIAGDKRKKGWEVEKCAIVCIVNQGAK